MPGKSLSPAKNKKGLTQYTPKVCAEVAKLMAAGLSATQVIAQWGITRDTFYNWMKKHSEFKEAYEMGKAKFDAKHEELGQLGMMKAIDIDYQFWRDLGKYRHGWSDKAEGGTTNNTQINIDNVNVLQQKSNDELIDYIKDNIGQLSEFTELEQGQIIDVSGNDSCPEQEKEV